MSSLPDGLSPHGFGMHMPVDRQSQQRSRRAEQIEIDRRPGAEGLQQAAGLEIDVEHTGGQVDAGQGGNMLAEG